MIEERKQILLLGRLETKLGLADPTTEQEDRLCCALDEAESELLLYLRMEELPDNFAPKVAQLAALIYRRDSADLQQTGIRAQSVTEDGLRQDVTYLTPEDYQKQAQGIYASIARYRQVRV